ncbi:MAG: hypothetical protein M1833_006640 [Piccolia ochrophora]|nr:MAG: hypothetical protein M1833_006640 [Piccolia ochrophora]
MLKPTSFPNGAQLLGAHAEGPFLSPSRKGAHDESLFKRPEEHTAEDVYGVENLDSSIKMVTVAPELAGAIDLISELYKKYDIQVSLGHSAADYETGVSGLLAGAGVLTHTFNAMNPLHHRTPGLAGLITSDLSPYYSVIADDIHLHPATLALAYRADPARCILITDAIEVGGLQDGVYAGHSQIPHPQRKVGSKVVIEGTEILIGGCSSIDECVQNLVAASGCSLAQSVQCVTENIVSLMGDLERGKLEVGRKADLVLLNDEGEVITTWLEGKMLFEIDWND